jgi:hypothetical protein
MTMADRRELCLSIVHTTGLGLEVGPGLNAPLPKPNDVASKHANVPRATNES